MENALDIDSDDATDLIAEIEKAFDIKISDDEAERCETVGDVFAVIRSHMNVVERDKALPCFSAATFRALRRAVTERDPSTNVTPKTSIEVICGSREPKKVWRYLETHSGLKLPLLWPAKITEISALLILISTSISLTWIGVNAWDALATSFLVGLLIGAVIAVLVLKFGPARIPEEITTLGDLASAATNLNIGVLANQFGAVRHHDVWSSLVYIVNRYVPSNKRINAETRFSPKRS